MKNHFKIFILLFLAAIACHSCISDCDLKEENCGGHETLTLNYLSKGDSTTNLFEDGTFKTADFTGAGLTATASTPAFVDAFAYSNSITFYVYDKRTTALVARISPTISDTIFVKTGLTNVSKCCAGEPIFEFAVLAGDTIRWASPILKTVNIYR